jgi:hypothetical protein
VNKRNAIRSSLLAVALVAAVAGTTMATAPNAFIGTGLAEGTLSESVHFNSDAIKFRAKEDVIVKTARVDIAAGGTSGWHTHPGIVLVTVQQGAVTFYDKKCSSVVHTAGASGSSFVETEGDGLGLARNEGVGTAVVYVTYIAPAGTTAFRIDAANPGCTQN